MKSLLRTAAALLAAIAFSVSPATGQTPTIGQSSGPKTYELPNSRSLRVKVRGGEIQVVVVGDIKGPRAPLMMLNGGPGLPHYGFVPALPLADQRAIILYDQLDSGKSDQPNDPRNWTIERYVSEIDAIRAALDIREFHLLGHSWGATLANEYASRAPAGLKSVILESPYVSTKSWNRSVTALVESLPADARDAIMLGEHNRDYDSELYKKALRSFNSTFYRRKPVKDALMAYLRTFPDFNFAPYSYFVGPSDIFVLGALKDYNAEDKMTHIEAPTLMLCGEYDQLSPTICRELTKKLPNGETAIIPDAGHLIQNDQPEQYIAVLRDWLARHD